MDEIPSSNGPASTLLEVKTETTSSKENGGGRKRPLSEESAPVMGDVVAIGATKRTKTDNSEAVNGGNGASVHEMKSESTSQDTNNENEAKNEKETGNNSDSKEGAKETAAAAAAMSPVLTRRRANKTKAATEESGVEEGYVTPTKGKGSRDDDAPDDAYGTRIQSDRWLVHQITEDYVDFVGRMMYPGTQFRPYGYDTENRSYPLEGISALGFLKSKLRRPTVIERWSPYEVALFEASLHHYGKEFNRVAREVGTKTTSEVIDFYYMWKKTDHYKKWKQTYVSDEDLIDFETPVKVKRGRK